MSSPSPNPPDFHPGARVRVAEGMFAGIPGEVLGPDPDYPPAVRVRLRIWGREVDVSLDDWQLEPAPSDH